MAIWIGAIHTLQRMHSGRATERVSLVAYWWKNAALRSRREASVEIIVVICPTEWSTRARPDSRSALRNMSPIT